MVSGRFLPALLNVEEMFFAEKLVARMKDRMAFSKAASVSAVCTSNCLR